MPLPRLPAVLVLVTVALPSLVGLSQSTRPSAATPPPSPPPPATTSPVYPPPSAEFLALVPDPAAVTKIASGLRFVEGPTWWPAKNALAFTDIPANVLYLLSPGGKPEAFLTPSGNANGTTLDADGNLLLARHGTHDVIRLKPDGTITVLVSQFQGKRLNSPNDLILTRSGDILFTDPPFGVKAEARELKTCGVYRLTPAGEISELIPDMVAPNGLALSPDEKTLYVAEGGRTSPSYINAYDFDGQAVTNLRKFYILPKGGADGMRVDKAGNLWTTAGDGVHVIAPTGALIGVILTQGFRM